MKTIVLFTSISGYTEKYARWISEDLGCECYSIDDFEKENLNGYDNIIYGGSLHAVGITGFRKLTKRFAELNTKNVFIFATGASPGRNSIPGEIMEKNFTADQRATFRFYYFRGGFNFRKLDPANRFIMNLMRLKIRLTPAEKRSPDETGMLAAFAQPVDFTKRDRITPLLDDIHSLN